MLSQIRTANRLQTDFVSEIVLKFIRTSPGEEFMAYKSYQNLIIPYFSRNPNHGVTKLPIAFDGISTLPEWPMFTNSTRKYLDMEKQSRMVVRNRLREKYCKFLKDPEGFIRQNVASKCKTPAAIAILLMFLLSVNINL